ncbi:hypothetical protein L0156_00355 [bacterium]|nr:hypothetical protein [bacterium]
MQRASRRPAFLVLITALLITASFLCSGCSKANQPAIPDSLQNEIKKHPPVADGMTPYRLQVPSVAVSPGFQVDNSTFSAFDGVLFVCIRSFPREESLIFMSVNEGALWTELKLPAPKPFWVSCVDSGALAYFSDGSWILDPKLLTWSKLSTNQQVTFWRFGPTELTWENEGLLVKRDKQWEKAARFPRGWLPITIERIKRDDASQALVWLYNSDNNVIYGHYLTGPGYADPLKRLQFEGQDPTSMTSLSGKLIAALSTGILKESNDLGDNWQDFGRPYPWNFQGENTTSQNPIRSLVTAGTRLYAATSTGHFSYDLRNGKWARLQNVPDDISRFVVVGTDRVLAVAPTHLYVATGLDNFQQCTWRSSVEVLHAGISQKMLFAITRPLHGKGEKTIWHSDDFGKKWLPGLIGQEIYDVALKERIVLALTNRGLQTTRDESGNWEPWGSQNAQKPDVFDKNDQIEISSDHVYRLSRGKVSRQQKEDTKWQEISTGLNDANLISITTSDKAVFVSTEDTVYTFNPEHLVWRPLNVRKLSDISRLIASGSCVCAVMGNAIHCFRNATDSNGWRPRAVGLRGKITDLWIDPEAVLLDGTPEMLVAGSDQGLFWSVDGGESFSEASEDASRISRVSSIARMPGAFVIASEQNIIYVVDNVDRGISWPAIIRFIKEDIPGGFWTILGSLLVLTFCSTRLASLLLQLNVPPFKWIAPWFYLTPVGRWKLYRRYRHNMRREREMTVVSERYVDLPYTATGLSEAASTKSISQAAWEELQHKAVTIVADGGRGKSTLARYIALMALNEVGGRKHVPVLVEGLAYTGNVISTVTGSLRRHRAYVNDTIVAAQLEAGYLLVLFDGYSEIREAFWDDAMKDIPQKVKQNPDARFLFASRTELPTDLRDALGQPVEIQLRDLSNDDIVPFLARYLPEPRPASSAPEITSANHSLERAGKLNDLLQERLPNLPRIPLMLRLVAEVYASEGNVPKDLPGVYSKFTDRLLRPDATGVKNSAGLIFGICHLVRETYLRNPGSRGVTVNRAVEILYAVKDPLEGFGINRPAIEVLNILISAGLYRRVGESYLKFFHDTFESYFAARALINDFDSEKMDFVKTTLGQAGLAEVRDLLAMILAAEGRLHDFVSRSKVKIQNIPAGVEDSKPLPPPPAYLPPAKEESAADWFMEANIAEGTAALETFWQKGSTAIPHVVDLLKQMEDISNRTHREQIHDRFKQFFASFEEESAKALVELVRTGDWKTGSVAAECFDIFSDEEVKVEAANQIADSFINSSGARLLEEKDQVRNCIEALGYLGAFDWRYAIRDVLEKTRTDLDGKFRFVTLQAAARFLTKQLPEHISLLNFMADLFEGYEHDNFSPYPDPVTDGDLIVLKRILRRRSGKSQADQFLKWLSNSGNNKSYELVRECCAHVLGSLGLQRAVATLQGILMDHQEPLALRAECALSLSRIQHKTSVQALWKATEALGDKDETIRRYALHSLLHVIHLGDDPRASLGKIFETFKPVWNKYHARQIGLCKAFQYADILDRLIQDNDSETRGQAGLAMARIYGGERSNMLQDCLEQADSPIERILFCAGLLQAGKSPGVLQVQSSLQAGLLDWPANVRQDVFSILNAAEPPYRNVADEWRDFLSRVPPNCDYGGFSALRKQSIESESTAMQSPIETRNKRVEPPGSKEDDPVKETKEETVPRQREDQTAPASMRSLKIFLASSGEMEPERREIELLIRRENDRMFNKGLYLQLIVWEELSHSFRGAGIQDHFNEQLLQCEVVIFLFFKKVGKFTKEEFELAYQNFKKGSTNPRYLYVLFKDVPVKISEIDEQILQIKKLKDQIAEAEQIYLSFESMAELQLKLKHQIDLILQETKVL